MTINRHGQSAPRHLRPKPVRLVPARRSISIFGRNITMARRNNFNSSTEPIGSFNSKRRTAMLMASSCGARAGMTGTTRRAGGRRHRSSCTRFVVVASPAPIKCKSTFLESGSYQVTSKRRAFQIAAFMRLEREICRLLFEFTFAVRASGDIDEARALMVGRGTASRRKRVGGRGRSQIRCVNLSTCAKLDTEDRRKWSGRDFECIEFDRPDKCGSRGFRPSPHKASRYLTEKQSLSVPRARKIVR